MKLYKYVPLHFVIRHHYIRHSWAFNFSYWWLLRCVTRSRYRPRASVEIPDVGERILPYIWGGGRRPPASHATLTTAWLTCVVSRRKDRFHASSSRRWKAPMSTNSRRPSTFWWRTLRVCQWRKAATPSPNTRYRSSRNTASTFVEKSDAIITRSRNALSKFWNLSTFSLTSNVLR